MSVAITGWGQLSGDENSQQPLHLQGAILNTVVKTECQDRYPQVGDAPLVCAGGRAVPQDTCFGDSGGPMAIAIQGRYHLLGVTSFGPADCASGPGVYASLNSDTIVNWIRSVAGGQCN